MIEGNCCLIILATWKHQLAISSAMWSLGDNQELKVVSTQVESDADASLRLSCEQIKTAKLPLGCGNRWSLSPKCKHSQFSKLMTQLFAVKPGAPKGDWSEAALAVLPLPMFRHCSLPDLLARSQHQLCSSCSLGTCGKVTGNWCSHETVMLLFAAAWSQLNQKHGALNYRLLRCETLMEVENFFFFNFLACFF